MKFKGFSTIEIMVAFAVFSVIVFTAGELFMVVTEAGRIGRSKAKAVFLASEYFEAVRNLKNAGWNNLTNGRYVVKNTPQGNLFLEATTSGEIVDENTRYLEISDAQRNPDGQIVESGGQTDNSTKKLQVNISWDDWHSGQLSQTTYLTRYKDNLRWQQSTVNQFNQGIMDLVKIVDPPVSDGEVQLQGGCFSGTPEALIYDDQLRNGWRSNCTGLPFFQWLICSILTFYSNATINTQSTTYRYNNSAYSIKIDFKAPSSGSSTSWVQLNNFSKVCTVGFRNIHFYVYNPAASPVDFWVTAVYGHWQNTHVTVPAGGWTEVSLDYNQVNEGNEASLQYLFFSKGMSAGNPTVSVYLDQMELTGGVGGYFSSGTLISSIYDTGQTSAFNRLEFNAVTPGGTQIGFQTATSNNSDGPWAFSGPAGTGLDTDLYTTASGSGIALGSNTGRYVRYKAYLKSITGSSTPILNDVTINYSP